MFEKLVLPIACVLVGIFAGVVFSEDNTFGQVDPIDRVIRQGDIIQIVPDGRVITFIHEGSVYTAVYDEGSELFVGEEYGLTAGGDLLPAKYFEKEKE